MIQQYQKKDGSTWWLFKAYLGIDPLTKKKVYTTRRGFKTKKEAKIAMSRLLLEVEKNGLNNGSDMLFKDLVSLWMETYKTTVKESSYSRTEIIMTKHIKPRFGEMKVSEITPAYCQKVVNYWSDHNAAKRFPLFVSYLKRLFRQAVNLGILQNNPAANVILPVKKDEAQVKELKFYSKEQLETFLAEINTEKIEYMRVRDYTLFRLLAFSGCRIGETLALDWSDIDFINNEISISKTIAKGEKFYVSSTAKTKKSNRIISIDTKTMRQLKKWQLEQAQFLLKHGFNKAAYVFTNDHNQFTVNSAVTERYKIYRDRAGLPDIGLHGFRHTHATMLFDAGADIKDVQDRLGHASSKITSDIYTHVTEKRKKDTAKLLTKYADF